MNCSTGKPGTPAYVMPAKECLSNMARLSLCGKLNLAIEKCNPYPFLIPYYGSKEFMTETALMHQIIQPFSVSQYVPLWERVLSILLKNQKVKDQKEVNTVNKIFVPHDVNSIWYMRDIKGMRVVANGLIYRRFADDISTRKFGFAMKEKPKDIMEINLGIDFGGSGSGHSFTATAITRGFQMVIPLASEWISCKDESGNPIEIDPDMLGRMFCNFVQKILSRHGYVTVVYADSAEQTLIAGIRSSLRKNGLGWIRVENALKTEINDRINATSILMAQGRFAYMDGECDSLVNALCTAVWDPKELTKNVRLDDGTSDIDSLDSFEYTIERQISQLIRYG